MKSRLALSSSLWLSASLAVTLAACGPKAAVQEARPDHVNPREFKVTGTLTQRFAKMVAEPHAEACDRSDLSRKQALLTALENAKDTLQGPPPSNDGTNQLPKDAIPFQGSYLIKLPKGEPRPGWISLEYSWQDALNLYEAKKGALSRGEWLRVNSIVMSTLMEDESRVVNGQNLGFDHLTIEHLPKIHEAVKACLKDEKCKMPDFHGEVALAVQAIPYYQVFFRNLEGANNLADAREILKRFEKRINLDQKDHALPMNPLLQKRTASGITEIRLPLDPGPLTDEEKKIVQSIIEEVWTKKDAKIQLEWKSKNENKDLFQILFHADGIGKRQFVSFRDNTLNLFPQGRARSIAHEFGHVLGFDDNYYTLWNSQTCAYTQESNDFDIMSNSSTGEVTDAEWKKLIESAKESTGNPPT